MRKRSPKETVDEPSTPHHSPVASSRLLRRRITVVIVGVGLAAVLCMARSIHVRRPSQDAPAAGGSAAWDAGEPPVDAAAVLRLPGALPGTVEQLNSEVLAIARLLVASLPERPESHAQAAYAHLQLGQEREALRCWQDALARDGNFADAHLGIGVLLEEQGDNEQAIASYRRAIALNPSLNEAYRELTEVLLRAGKAEEALPVAQEGVQRFATVADYHFWLGQVHLELGDFAAARQAHLEAVRLNPESALPYFPLARACARLGKHDEAARYRDQFAKLKAAELAADGNRNKSYDDLATQKQRVVKRHVLAGSLHLQFGDLRLAEAHWVRAAAIDPTDVATRKALVSLYQNQTRPAAELQYLAELIRLEPEQVEHALRSGRLRIELQAWAQAEAELKTLVERQPQSPDAHLLLAEMYLKTGATEAAAKHADQAASLAPSSPGLLLLAAIRDQGGDRSGALAALEQAMSLDPENAALRRMYEQLRTN